MFNDSEVATISVVEETSLNLSDVYDSYLYEISSEGLSLNNLSLVLEE